MLTRLRRWLGQTRSDHHVWIEEKECDVLVKNGQTLLQAALDAGIDFPHLCRVGSCGRCKYRLVSGSAKMLVDASYVLTAKDLADGYMLACQTVMRSDAHVSIGCSVEAAKAAQQRNPVRGTILAIKPLTPRVFEMRIALDQVLEYRPGQYAQLYHPELKGGRAYSFVEPTTSQGAREVTFHISPAPGGQFSQLFASRDLCGDSIHVHGPYGDFGWVDDGDAPVLCAAGGSGIGVMKTILEQAVLWNKCGPMVFLYGARHEADLYWLDELEKIKDRWQAPFSLIPVLSDEPGGSGWEGETGMLSDVLDSAKFTGPISSWRALLCGPPQMVDSVVDKLSSIGFSAAQIAFDKFESGGTVSPDENDGLVRRKALEIVE